MRKVLTGVLCVSALAVGSAASGQCPGGQCPLPGRQSVYPASYQVQSAFQYQPSYSSAPVPAPAFQGYPVRYDAVPAAAPRWRLGQRFRGRGCG